MDDPNPAEIALRRDQLADLSVELGNNRDISLLLEHIFND
jgi:hypothetical protein